MGVLLLNYRLIRWPATVPLLAFHPLHSRPRDKDETTQHTQPAARQERANGNCGRKGRGEGGQLSRLRYDTRPQVCRDYEPFSGEYNDVCEDR
jgi:hypothetical protein